MFTGIVLGLGLVEALEPRGKEMRLTIRALCDLPQLVVGESIAVNGACLTVEQGSHGVFTAYASEQTMSRTSLDSLRHGGHVNLERALALGDRLGGHLVSGHVDGLATVATIAPAGQSHRVRLHVEPSFGPEIIPKGSVTLDGVSLTVNDCGRDFLEVNVIPETWHSTTMTGWSTGTRVNLETDVIGKYVRHMLHPYTTGGSATSSRAAAPVLSMDFLRENGFV